LKNPNTCWGGYTRAFGGELVNWIGPDGTSIVTVPRYEIEALKSRSTWQTIASDNSKEYLEAAFKYGIENPIGMCLQDAGWKNGPWLGKVPAKYPTTYTTWSNYVKNIVTKKPAVDWHFSQEDVQVSLVWGAQVLQQIAKQVRVSENKTGRAEKLAAMAKLYKDIPYANSDFDEAWRGILLAQHHDCWIVPYNGRRGNTWIDKVARWTATADSISDESITKSVEALTSNSANKSNYIRVFNTSVNARKELVKIAIPSNIKPGEINIVDENNEPVAAQIISDSIAFLAVAPSMGYATYKLRNKKANAIKDNSIALQQDGTYKLESDLYRVIIDPAKGGTIKSLIAKKLNNKEFVDQANSAGFNGLKGYFFKDSNFFSSNHNAASISITVDGPLYCKVSINGKINGQSFIQTVALTRGEPVIDMSVMIDWQNNPGIGDDYKQNGGYRPEDYHKAFYDDSDKLQTLFPLNLDAQQVYKNAPFDVTKSKLSNTFFQTWDSIKNNVLLNWVDVTDGQGKYGMALFSDHTTSYTHGQHFPLGLTTQYSGIGLWGGDYSLTGPTELHYAIVPHEGKWNDANIWNTNTNWNNPLTATIFQAPDQLKDFTKSLISTKENGLELTAVTMDGNDLLVRFFNAESKTATQQIAFDGYARQVIVEELNGKIKETLNPIISNKKTTINTAMTHFGVCTIRLKNFTANH
ncbi:MAG: glycoside hydrolase family 38 C-terminal domain-containing protein, partial [Ferruginibacter sp.]